MEAFLPLCFLAVALLCVVLAVILMLKDKEGWGWLLALALFFGSAPLIMERELTNK